MQVKLHFVIYLAYVIYPSDCILIWYLRQTFQNKQLAYAVKEGTLDRLITELLLWLLDERVPRMDDGSQLLKALNVLMLKILVHQTENWLQCLSVYVPLQWS